MEFLVEVKDPAGGGYLLKFKDTPSRKHDFTVWLYKQGEQKGKLLGYVQKNEIKRVGRAA